ncbi:MAG: TRAP transporter substrate-binding protein [Aquisalimonadaceae bacterium]
MGTQVWKGCVLAAVGALFASSAQAQTVLTLNRWLPPNHFINTEVLEPWAADVEQATEGRVRIDIPSSSLGPPPRQFDLARRGVADITWSTQGYTPGRFVTSEGVELPFLSNSAEALSVAFWRTHNDYFAEADEYSGVKVLSLHVQPPGSLFTARQRVESLSDIRNLSIRVINPATSRLLEAFDGVPISAPVGQAYEMLSRGVIDGTFLTTDSMPNLNLWGHLNHLLTVDGGFYNTSFFLVMNRASWDRLSEADQQAIESISGEAFSKRVGRIWDDKHAKALEEFEARAGTTHTRVEGKELERLRNALATAEPEWIASVQEKGVNGEAALEMLRREVADY